MFFYDAKENLVRRHAALAKNEALLRAHNIDRSANIKPCKSKRFVVSCDRFLRIGKQID
jgi:hypothetical protein